ncbi:GNAT family N-acetyltransferase [Streptomyces sp. BE20]|uniref:GNAT family N-acetyltransferase n=1 Tax=Streptomyces sp. BE20 TaxID=3002525 RepID=UPI002E78B933|nr:GNAT family N-acetyltransferase [Streptomyces sp. BE20]MEE1823878.1 GNAT family N-acetyltransferase [Streptomyces sp. BE20]
MDLLPPVIDLGDLTLRRFTDADLAELFQVIGESLEHLSPWMPWAADHSLIATAEFLARRPGRWAGGDFTYAITLDGAIVGTCSLFRGEVTRGAGRGIGYWLHPAATGRGIAARAARALADEAFRLPGVDYVEIVHDPANRASGAVAARLGFTPHGRRPAERLAPAETGEEQVWRLTRPRTATSGTGSPVRTAK